MLSCVLFPIVRWVGFCGVLVAALVFRWSLVGGACVVVDLVVSVSF